MAIRVLDKQTANLIAAGEVVERPASVIKELVENAVDAGATRITVEIQRGGMAYIRVTDNGSGIPADQVATAFLRHATSKIATGADLAAIGTLGFRGEALASIAAVARVEVLTRTADRTAGTSLTIEGGEVTEQAEAGCPVGTTMIVRNLFFNTPARMKFLKSDAAETGHITDLMGKCMLCHPEVSFTYINSGKTVLQTPGNGDVRSAIYTVLGREVAQNLLPVTYSDEVVAIEGYVGNFSLSRRDRRQQLFFLNGRNIVSRTLSAAVSEGYANAMMVGKFPVCVLHMTTAPAFVDVNVHPAKLEVRFSDEKAVYHAMALAVQTAVHAARHVPELTRDKEPPPVQTEIFTSPPRQEPEPESEPESEPERYIPSYARPSAAMLRDNPMPDPDYPATTIAPVPAEEMPPAETGSPAMEQPTPPAQPNLDFWVIGQAFSTYLLVQQGDALLLIDQHAAHERLCFEELLEEYRTRQVSSQLMLLPVTLRLDSTDFATVTDHLALFSEIGFDIDIFGDSEVIVRAVPAPLSDDQIADLVQELAGLIADNARTPQEQLAQQALHTVACKRALKGNRFLTKAEQEHLCQRVLALPGINTCPHGRPIMIKMTRYELEKQFKRIV